MIIKINIYIRNFATGNIKQRGLLYVSDALRSQFRTNRLNALRPLNVLQARVGEAMGVRKRIISTETKESLYEPYFEYFTIIISYLQVIYYYYYYYYEKKSLQVLPVCVS